MKFGAIIIATGYSSRMKAFKPLMKIGGNSLLSCCVSLFKRKGIDTTLVVTGHKGKSLNKEARTLEVELVRNHDQNNGMYSSVCCGVKKLSGVDGFFLLPVDIPLVRSVTISTLIEHFDGNAVLFPCFDKQQGHPLLIPTRFVSEILKYDGSGGLKELLKQLKGKDVAVWDQSILFDMDHTENDKKITQYHSRMDIGTRAEAVALASIMMSDKGVSHGREVAAVAETMGKALNANGYNFDLVLLHNSGLLHDIAKGQHHHDKRGAELLRDCGFSGLAECVRSHRDVVPSSPGKLSEVALVCLADKLVCGSRRVSVKHRYEEKLSQYKNDPAACKAIKRRMANGLGLLNIVEEACGRGLKEILGTERGVRAEALFG